MKYKMDTITPNEPPFNILSIAFKLILKEK